MSFVGGSIAWRLPIAVQMIFAVFVIILLFGLPESPRWLYAKDRGEDAIRVLCTVYDKQERDELVIHQKQQICDAIELEEKNGGFRWRNVLQRDEVQTGKRVLLAWGMQVCNKYHGFPEYIIFEALTSLQFMNQVGGINLVVYYIPCKYLIIPLICSC